MVAAASSSNRQSPAAGALSTNCSLHRQPAEGVEVEQPLQQQQQHSRQYQPVKMRLGHGNLQAKLNRMSWSIDRNTPILQPNSEQERKDVDLEVVDQGFKTPRTSNQQHNRMSSQQNHGKMTTFGQSSQSSFSKSEGESSSKSEH